jgi:vanillate O-demethylase ferredoxin subunit
MMITVRVAGRAMVAKGIVSLDLVAAEGGELPPFSAGAHVDLMLPNGLVRQYSLSNAPGEGGRYRIAVLRDPVSRGGSINVHDALCEGATFDISAPRNAFGLEENGAGFVLLAGGVGITPILSMAHRLQTLGKPFALHYCARDPAHAAFLDEAAALFPDQLRGHFDSQPDTRLDLAAALADPGPGRHLYVCGPRGFMDFVVSGAQGLGWPLGQVHQESFSAAPLDPSAATFSLRIASTGQVISVSPDQTAAEALEAAGVSVPLSCEQGVCGTCLTPVIDGEPDHRDLYQTDAEKAANTHFTPCCSRAKSAMLTLDL